MSQESKKMIPKIKKKFQWFLSDESGKISKEDVLKMWMMAMWVVWFSSTVAWAHTNHTNSTVNAGSQVWNYTTISGPDLSWWAWYSPGSASCNVNVTVNGHYNNANFPWTVAGGGITWVNVHANHVNY